ncbi:HAMP domain-containing sensor histidine kinase [Paenibacillus sp. MMS20-IR301]|uniref:sensor histidine kinase n=1 Tax=Paenibacillus sp. MMS20-IR301 TaxID=2895946 RepID=UPI0028EDAFBB|nr:HAMP domain-containing sensor histidine kinase [Paenibacillus sp. MMS20-IR301]WNS45140.1 HAMP domain-containing sensor histidine kinase [Paenibacillus sp. MMS20-IR301]
MSIRLIKEFLRDQRDFTVVYFLSHVLISLYSNHYLSSSIRLLYPFSIYAYIYLIFMGYRFFRYAGTTRELRRLAENIDIEDKPYSAEQQVYITLMRQIHRSYQEQLYEVRAKAENTHRFISQWIHSMKTPLSVIDLIVQNYKLNEPDIHPSEAMEQLAEEKDRILGMLNQVLQYFRLEQFTRDCLPENIGLMESLRGIINRMRNQFIYNHVYPVIDGPEDDLLITTDGKWNTVLLEQIISNSIKYSEAGEEGKPVHFRAWRAGDKAVLSIRDEGIGIDRVDLQRVFQPFFTGKNGRSAHQATGIGLFVCAEISRKLGHSLEITSETGKGTEVKITYLSKMKESIT